jgi:hypothetical protein
VHQQHLLHPEVHPHQNSALCHHQLVQAHYFTDFLVLLVQVHYFADFLLDLAVQLYPYHQSPLAHHLFFVLVPTQTDGR